MTNNWIKEQRENLGMSQDELAAQLQAAGLDVTRATVSHWETGRYSSPLDNARDIIILANVLKISVADLLKVAGYEVSTRSYGELARRAAFLVDQLSPEIQELAVEQLSILYQYLSTKKEK
jgi:transcriptional regulator with XRE-family HTH domain